jgi:hypothetical protein
MFQGTALAKRRGKPYPPTFRFYCRVDPPGIEPALFPENGPACRTGIFPLDDEPIAFSVTAFSGPPRNRTAQVSGVTGRRAEPASSRWTSSPCCMSFERSVPELNGHRRAAVVLPPYHGGVLPKHLQTGDPGWNRTIVSWTSTKRLRRWTTGSSFR